MNDVAVAMSDCYDGIIASSVVAESKSGTDVSTLYGACSASRSVTHGHHLW